MLLCWCNQQVRPWPVVFEGHSDIRSWFAVHWHGRYGSVTGPPTSYVPHRVAAWLLIRHRRAISHPNETTNQNGACRHRLQWQARYLLSYRGFPGIRTSFASSWWCQLVLARVISQPSWWCKSCCPFACLSFPSKKFFLTWIRILIGDWQVRSTGVEIVVDSFLCWDCSCQLL